MNGKCSGEFRSCTVANTVIRTIATFTARPRNGLISATNAPSPSMHVNSIITQVFHTGLTERSLWSIISPMTTMATPTREFTSPNTAVMPPTTRTMARKNSVLLTSLFISMSPVHGLSHLNLSMASNVVHVET